MATSAGKPTAVHYSLVFFVATTMLAGAVAYLQHTAYTEEHARYLKLEETNRNLTNANRNYDDAIQAMKAMFGHGFDDVGSVDEPNTMMWAVANDIRTYGGYPQGSVPTVHDALLDLRAKLDSAQDNFNTENALRQDKDQQFLALEENKKVSIEMAREDQTSAETQLRDLQKEQDELLADKDKLYQQKVQELAQERNEHQQDLEASAKQIADLEEENKNLIAINERLQKKIDNIQQVSFEVADGEVRWVDHVARLVWINVGSDDRLSKRTTFSVYKKGHHGIGRGAEDIKGSIEVTRIIGPHLAEARILDKDIYEPMAPGDPIYTPLWSPGRSESFSLIGFIDLDGDGTSDRELLIEQIRAAGGRVDNVVDDQGNRTGDGITVQTKFLVVGELPDPATTSDPDEQKMYRQILSHFTDMEKEARQQGVRRVNLGDFLAYIGYQPSRRLWRPGEGTPFTLKSGSHSTATNETIGNRESSGQTTGAYSRSKRLKQPKSTGQTSKVFGRGY